MADQNVPVVKTKFTNLEFAKAIIGAWKRLFNVTPTKSQVGLVIAQHVIETGSGNYCWNFNTANIKKFAGDGHSKYMMLSGTWEILNGKKCVFNPPHPQTWFRAYDTLEDGTVDYLRLVSGKRYKPAWAALLTGSPEEFAHRLKECHYYTADESAYARLLRTWFDKFVKTTDYETALAQLNTAPPAEADANVELNVVPDVSLSNQDLDFGHAPSPNDDDLAPISLPPLGQLYNFLLMIWRVIFQLLSPKKKN